MEIRKLTTEMRVESEAEVQSVIEDFKTKSRGVVTYKTQFKQKTQKGEVVDQYYILTICEDFTK